MLDNIRYKLFMITTLVGICLLVPIKSEAQVTLDVVYPYIGQNKIDVCWQPVINAQEYAYRRRENNGSYSEWRSVGLNTCHVDVGLSSSSNYFYEVRAKVNGVWSAPSTERGNGFARVWPVRKASDSVTESVELLHGFGQPIAVGSLKYFHEGIDIHGESSVDNEVVRAPVGGIVEYNGGSGSDIGVVLRVNINGSTFYISFNHLLRNIGLNRGTSVMAGDLLGVIGSGTGFWPHTLSNHTHCGFHNNLAALEASCRNPFDIWNQAGYRDPQQKPPQVLNTNPDSDSLRFKKVPNSKGYLPHDGKVYNAVDIVVEAIDKQSSDAPWQVPKIVGYYIQSRKNGTWTDKVRTSDQPYILVDNQNFYDSYSTSTNDDLIKKIIDYADNLNSNTPTEYDFRQWFTYIVTNTSGTIGHIFDIDSDQCWATNAKKSVSNENGYESGSQPAGAIEEAKFPDGKYRVKIRLQDHINTASDFEREIFVDNFRPYIKKVDIKSGDLDYTGIWNWDENAEQLKFEKITTSGKACGAVQIKITTSEPMKNVSVSIPSLSFEKNLTQPVQNTDATEWEFEIPSEKTKDASTGPHKIMIDGVDSTDNALQGFKSDADIPGSSLQKKDPDGNWVPNSGPGKDEVHEFEITVLEVNISGTGTTEICDNEPAQVMLTASVSGGSGEYDYSWPGGSLMVTSSGYYSVTVTDKQNGCEGKAEGDVVIIRVLCSSDPNDIIGPEGYGPHKMIAKSKTYSYMVRFENDPDFATAPAQIVKINHPLDTNTNLLSLRLGEFGFGGFIFTIPAPERTFYSTRLNLMDSLGVVVDVTAGIDIIKKEAFWIFESKDPNTGLPPANATLGFLPVNDSTAKGEGFVTYFIKAANHTRTGDSIRAKASIVFDVNAPIETPPIFNIIDAVAPTSNIQSMSAITSDSSLTIKWSGRDDPGGSGVRDYTLYVSQNGGSFSAYRSGIIDTAINFSGRSNNTYGFFVQATDNVGNQEALKNLSEVTVTVQVSGCSTEICNGIDDDCDNLIDEGCNTFYLDRDRDGYGITDSTIVAAFLPPGYAIQSGDCHDWNASIYPGAKEVCNWQDDNCNGQVDEGCNVYYRDADGDGYGRWDQQTRAMTPPAGYSSIGGDCHDWNASIYPGATEVCNWQDDNCDGFVDERCNVYYRDADNDGYGRWDQQIRAMTLPPGYASIGGDCNDSNPSIRPGAMELCNGLDDNCNGIIDELCMLRNFYRDADGDGFGRNDVMIFSGIQPPGYVPLNGDCNDWNPAIRPFATEVCNWQDDNCNGQIDEGCNVYYRDADGDGYGRWDQQQRAMVRPPGYAFVGGDCNDLDASIRPGVTEVCNLKDDNCNGLVDEWCVVINTKTSNASDNNKNKQPNNKSETKEGETAFNIVVYPVPTDHFFNVYIQGDYSKGKISLRVLDYLGRLVETKDNLVIGQMIKIGADYTNGLYILEAVQGGERRTIKITKL